VKSIFGQGGEKKDVLAGLEMVVGGRGGKKTAWELPRLEKTRVKEGGKEFGAFWWTKKGGDKWLLDSSGGAVVA